MEKENGTEIVTMNLTSLYSVHTYISNLTLEIVTLSDAGLYICNVTYLPLNDTIPHNLIGEVFVDVQG